MYDLFSCCPTSTIYLVHAPVKSVNLLVSGQICQYQYPEINWKSMSGDLTMHSYWTKMRRPLYSIPLLTILNHKKY